MEQDNNQQVFSREEYAKKDFWQERYAGKKLLFDWYVEYPELKQSFEVIFELRKSTNILMLGCGNSKLSEQMYDAGYHNIVNIDISPSVIEQMQTTTDAKGKVMKWLVMDGCDLKFPNGQFDVIVDKGTLDAVICGKDLTISNKMLEEAKRVLKPTGKIVVITHGPPEGRKKVFEKPLPFGEFDYYFTKLGLSDSSMLINLMRSNLKDKPLKGILENKEALQRTMVEYKLLQLIKKMKRTTKYKIYWSQTAQKEVEDEPEPAKEVEEIPAAKEEQPVDQQSPAKPAKPLYDPRKQSYCFVYCVQLKPHRVLQHLTQLYSSLEKSSVEQQLQGMGITHAAHEPTLETFEINPQVEECLIISTVHTFSLLLAVKHLQVRGGKFPRLIVNYSGKPDKALSLQADPTPEKSVISRLCYEFTEGDHFQASVLTSVKANIKLSLSHSAQNTGFGRETFSILQDLQELVDTLDIGLEQPNPFIYETLTAISVGTKQSLKELIRKYWEPELIVSSLVNSNSVVQIEATISLPPNSLGAKLFELIQSRFGKYEPTLISADSGFLSENPKWLTKALTGFSKSYIAEDLEYSPVWDLRQSEELKAISRDPRQQHLFLSKPHAASVMVELISSSV